MLPVLLTRPADRARAFARRLRAAGAGRVVVAPLVAIEPVARALPPLPGGVLLTSLEAARLYARLGGPAGRAAWVVGPATAAAARAAGLDLRGVAPDAAALAALVPVDAGPLTHLRGEDQRGDLAATLRARGVEAGDAVLYRQAPLPLGPEARALLVAPVVAPVFSPLGAARLRDALPAGALGRLRVAAISAAAAAPLAGAPVRVAARPDGAGVLEATLGWLRREGG